MFPHKIVRSMLVYVVGDQRSEGGSHLREIDGLTELIYDEEGQIWTAFMGQIVKGFHSPNPRRQYDDPRTKYRAVAAFGPTRIIWFDDKGVQVEEYELESPLGELAQFPPDRREELAGRFKVLRSRLKTLGQQFESLET